MDLFTIGVAGLLGAVGSYALFAYPPRAKTIGPIETHYDQTEDLLHEARKIVSPSFRDKAMTRRAMVEKLENLKIRGLDLDGTEGDEATLLQLSIHYNDVDAFEALIQAGASPKVKKKIRDWGEKKDGEWDEFLWALSSFHRDPSMRPVLETLLNRSPSKEDSDYAERIMSDFACLALSEKPMLAAALYELGADPNLEIRSGSITRPLLPKDKAALIFEQTGDPTAVETLARAGGRFDGCSAAVIAIAERTRAELERSRLTESVAETPTKTEGRRRRL